MAFEQGQFRQIGLPRGFRRGNVFFPRADDRQVQDLLGCLVRTFGRFGVFLRVDHLLDRGSACWDQVADSPVIILGILRLGQSRLHISARLTNLLRPRAGFQPSQHLFLRVRMRTCLIHPGLQSRGIQLGEQLSFSYSIPLNDVDRLDPLAVVEGQLHLANVHIAIKDEGVRCPCLVQRVPGNPSAASEDDCGHRNNQGTSNVPKHGANPYVQRHN